jgi:hypothetical protein
VSEQILNINRAMVGGELDCALRMFRQAALPLSMAKSHLKNASNLASPAFTKDPTRKQQLDALIAAIENLFAAVDPLTKPSTLPPAPQDIVVTPSEPSEPSKSQP